MRISGEQLLFVAGLMYVVRMWELKWIFTDKSKLNQTYKSVFPDVDQPIEIIYTVPGE